MQCHHVSKCQIIHEKKKNLLLLGCSLGYQIFCVCLCLCFFFFFNITIIFLMNDLILADVTLHCGVDMWTNC
jgi:hypothetical protein